MTRVPGPLVLRPLDNLLRRVLRWLGEDDGAHYPPCPCDAPGLPFADREPTAGRSSPQPR